MKSRFAPSPTGDLHIGSIRTALFAWAWAKKHQGKFVLRIEDTDIERSTKSSINNILESMDWLGLEYEEGPFYQTNNFDRYKEIIKQLLNNDKAYYCQCSKERLQKLREDALKKGDKAKYDGHCKNKNLTTGVVRFKNPTQGLVVFNDEIKGEIIINNKELDDLIIARYDSTPTYNLTVVIDDHDMGIDYVIRGDDHINNTPRQINLYKALNWDLPKFAHLPMILGSDGKRLSKRHAVVGIMNYKQQGFLPEALLNYLARLGWSYGDKELFSINELIELFTLKNINKSPAIFDSTKLLWINQEHIKNSSIKNINKHLAWHLQQKNIIINDGPDINKVIQHLQQRSKTLVDMAEQSKMFYQDFDKFEENLANKHFKDKKMLQLLLSKLEKLNIWEADNIKIIIQDVCSELDIGFGKVGQPFRLALSGSGNAGNIDITAELVGKKRTLQRLKMAINF
jgi:glutamyl-tRNA synthetase